MGFTFCIDITHNTIQSQRNRVHFAHNMLIIGLGALVLFIIGYIWYLVAYDAPLSLIPSSVDATTTAVAYLLSFHAPLHGYRLGSFITMCPTHIRILDSLLMAFVAILYISGGLLALRATELAISSSFSALSVSILVLLIGLLSLAVIILAAHDASLSTISLFVSATVTAIACLSSISYQASLSGYGYGSFVTFQASLRGYGSFIAEYFARIRNSYFLLMLILFVSGALLALGAAELVVASSLLALGAAVLVLSFAALSHGYVFILIAMMYITHIRAFVAFILFLGVVLASGAVVLAVISSFFAFVAFILFLGEVLASGVAMLPVIPSFSACIRCISFGIIHGLPCICLSVLKVIYIIPPLRILCIAISVMLFGLSHFGAIGRIFACNKLVCFALHCVVLLYCLTYNFDFNYTVAFPCFYCVI